MPDAIMGMPFRSELRTKSDACRVSDTTNDTAENRYAIVNRRIDVDSLTVRKKRLR
jgi:hypothetical protein